MEGIETWVEALFYSPEEHDYLWPAHSLEWLLLEDALSAVLDQQARSFRGGLYMPRCGCPACNPRMGPYNPADIGECLYWPVRYKTEEGTRE
jgi:hypothetical protein